MLYTCLSLEYSSYKIQYWRQKTIKIELLWSILLPNISFADILFCKTIISMKRFTITLTSGTEFCSGYQFNLAEVISPPWYHLRSAPKIWPLRASIVTCPCGAVRMCRYVWSCLKRNQNIIEFHREKHTLASWIETALFCDWFDVEIVKCDWLQLSSDYIAPACDGMYVLLYIIHITQFTT